MQAILYGVRRVDMQSEDGRSIKGFSCFIGYPAAGVQGDEVSKVFVSDDLAQTKLLLFPNPTMKEGTTQCKKW